ncbi:MAG: response regulator, partial [Oscillospiraceae bacterium]
MYKILLVEDEPEVLNAMVSTLHWNDLGFETPVACAHGQAAIDAMEGGFVPHAVITDICMPFVDGVQLTSYIAEHFPATLVVMLTGYDDFSYAHKAIKLKVYDYVLKPITPNSLRELATKLCNELDDRRVKNTDEFDALARERFLTSLLTAQLDEKTICDGLRVHKIPCDCPFWL